MTMVAAAKPIAMLRIMMLILRYSISGRPSCLLSQTQPFTLSRSGAAWSRLAPLPMNAE
jgi:hypothetical protein